MVPAGGPAHSSLHFTPAGQSRRALVLVLSNPQIPYAMKLLIATAALLVCSLSLPQEEDLPTVLVHTFDQHTSEMTLASSIEITTPYGVLNVPAHEVLAIRCERRLTADERNGLQSKLTDLASTEERKIDAVKKIFRRLACSETLGLLESAMSHESEAVRTNAEALLMELADSTYIGTQPDIVVTSLMTIAGRIGMEELTFEDDLGRAKKIRTGGIKSLTNEGYNCPKIELPLREKTHPQWRVSALEVQGWRTVAFDDTGWDAAASSDAEESWIVRDEQPGMRYARRKFFLSSKPAQATVEVQLVEEARLFVNGVEMTVPLGQDRAFNVDVAHLLRVGPNVIAITVRTTKSHDSSGGFRASLTME